MKSETFHIIFQAVTAPIAFLSALFDQRAWYILVISGIGYFVFLLWFTIYKIYIKGGDALE